MSRISKVYDDDLQEQVFMVRGDESYVRSTGITAELAGANLEEHTFTQNFKVNVYRDYGESNVCIYVNDELVKCTEWKSTMESAVISVDGLYYDTEYVFKVVYMGNDQCLRSSTKNIRLVKTVGNPSKIDLTFDKNIYFRTDGKLHFSLQLLSTDGKSRGANQPIELQVEGSSHIATEFKTDGNGKAEHELNIQNLKDGLYTFTFTYRGSQLLDPSTASKQISIGYQLIPSGNRKVVVEGTTSTFGVQLTDYLRTTGYSNKLISLMNDREVALCPAVLTDDKGIAIFKDVQISKEVFSDRKIYYLYKDENEEEYKANVDVVYVDPKITSITKTPEVITKSDEVVLKVTMENHVEGIPLTIQRNGTIINTIYTNKNGIASTSYKAEGTGKTIITANCGKQSKEIEFWECLQCWTPTHKPSADQYILSDSIKINALTDTFEAKIQGSGFAWALFDTFEDTNIPLVLKLSGVTFPKSTIAFGGSTTDDFRKDPSMTFDTKYFQKGTNLNNDIIRIDRNTNNEMGIQVGEKATRTTHPNENKKYPLFIINSKNASFKFNKLELWKGE